MIARPFVRAFPFMVAGLVATGPVLAQPAPSATTKPAASHRQPAASDKQTENHVERRIAALRAKLKVTPAEMPVFDEFAGVMRENAAHMDTLLQQRHATLASGTAVDDMRSYQGMAQAHVDDLSRLVPAFEKLYDTLSPEQKKLADQSFRDFEGCAHGVPRRGCSDSKWPLMGMGFVLA